MIRLHHLGKLEKYYRVRTDNPVEEIWSELLKLADFQFLKRYWKDVGDSDIFAVGTYLKQAYEYFTASKTVSLLTKPVITYYSLLNLAKACIYIKTDKPPSEYHGLCNPGYSSDLLDLSARTNNGVFTELGKIYGLSIDVGKTFFLKDFLSNAVELRASIKNYFNLSPEFISPKVDTYVDGTVLLNFSNYSDIAQNENEFINILKTNTHLFDDFDVDSKEPQKIILKIKTPLPKNKIDEEGSKLMSKHFRFSVFDDNEYHLYANDQKSRIEPIQCYLGSMFILSSIVRYSPNCINQFLLDRTSSNTWFIRNLCDTSERVFPNLIFSSITGRNYKFAGSFGW